MDADFSPDVGEEPIDPLGPPVLRARVRYGARALALSGAVAGAAVVTHLVGWGTMTPPLN